MELKLNSWYVWLWNYTYDEKLPSNLCPFFWKLVLAIILFIPNFILRLPLVIGSIFNKKIEKESSALGVIIWLILSAFTITTYSLFHFFMYLFDAYSYDSGAASCGGIVLVSLGVGIIYNYLHNKSYYLENSLKNNIIISYSKSVYGKYCPRINWK
jgi:hypothetical protein